MDIIQKFYDDLAGQYDKLFLDWEAATREQAEILDRLFAGNGFDRSARILDCACGIGTQALGLAALGIYISSIPLISTLNTAQDAFLVCETAEHASITTT